MLRVSVHSKAVINKQVVSRSGQPYNIREQEAIVYTVGRDGRESVHGVPMVLGLRDRQAYDVGEYELCESSIYVNRWGQLEITPVLVLVEHQQSKAA